MSHLKSYGDHTVDSAKNTGVCQTSSCSKRDSPKSVARPHPSRSRSDVSCYNRRSKSPRHQRHKRSRSRSPRSRRRYRSRSNSPVCHRPAGSLRKLPGMFLPSEHVRSRYPHHTRRHYRSRSNSPDDRLHTKSRDRHTSSSSLECLSNEMKILLSDCQYFLIKSSNYDNLLLAKAESVWSTPPQNEARINEAFRVNQNVILIFTVKDSNEFQGYARVSAESNRMYPPLPWVLPVGLSAKSLSGVFTLDWITTNNLPFSKTRHLCNSLNMNRPVAFGRDGQEIECHCGRTLCSLFDVDQTSEGVQRAVQKSLTTQHLRSGGKN